MLLEFCCLNFDVDTFLIDVEYSCADTPGVGDTDTVLLGARQLNLRWTHAGGTPRTGQVTVERRPTAKRYVVSRAPSMGESTHKVHGSSAQIDPTAVHSAGPARFSSGHVMHAYAVPPMVAKVFPMLDKWWSQLAER